MRLRLLAGVGASLVGAVLLASVVVLSMPAQAPRAAAVLRDAEPVVAGSGLTGLRESLDATASGLNALAAAVRPQTDADGGEPTDQLLARYPAVQVALARAEEIGGAAEKVVANLERNQADFRRANGIRSGPVPLSAFPVMAAAIGLVLIAVGIATTRGWGRGPAMAVGVGLSMVVMPLSLGTPGQMQSAGAVLDSLKVGPDIPVRTREQFEVVERAAGELPGLVEELEASGSGSPAINRLAETLPETLRRFEQGVIFREKHGGDVAALKDLPMGSLAWALPILGAALMAAALPALPALAGRRSRSLDVEPGEG